MARMVQGRGVYRVLVGKPEGKRPLGRPRGVFRPRQTRPLPSAVDLKGRLLSCQCY